MKKYHSRFKDAKWYDPGQEVTIGGAGGIGSWLCVLIARIGCKIRLFEMDTIDHTNMGGQLYPIKSVGKTKAETIHTVVKDFAAGKVKLLGELQDTSTVTPITFSAFDNMAARKVMFEKWTQLENKQVFIDGRMLVESGQVFVVLPGEQEEVYSLFLFDDAEIEDQPCSFKATSHSGAMIASLMTSLFTNYWSNQKRKIAIREVPMLTIYNLPSMSFEHFTTEQTIEFYDTIVSTSKEPS